MNDKVEENEEPKFLQDSEEQVCLGHLNALRQLLHFDDPDIEGKGFNELYGEIKDEYMDRLKKRLSGRLSMIKVFLASGYMDLTYCIDEIREFAKQLEYDTELTRLAQDYQLGIPQERDSDE